MGEVTAPRWLQRGDVVTVTTARPRAWVIAEVSAVAGCALLVRTYSTGAVHREWFRLGTVVPAPADHPDRPALLEALWAS